MAASKDEIPGLEALKLDVPEPGDAARIQAMIGNAKKQNTVVISGRNDEEFTCDDFESKATLLFEGLKGSKVTVGADCTKIFVDGCTNCTFSFKSRVLTKTIEFYRCGGCSVEAFDEIGTLQLDMCPDTTKVHYEKKEQLNTIIWAGVDELEVSFGDVDDTHKSSYADILSDPRYKDLNKERGQFIVRWVEGELLQEKIIRLPNGFPTTQREKDEFDKRQEANLEKLASEMGIKINPVRSNQKKIPPNKPCPKCGSGKKYKKCCGANAP